MPSSLATDGVQQKDKRNTKFEKSLPGQKVPGEMPVTRPFQSYVVYFEVDFPFCFMKLYGKVTKHPRPLWLVGARAICNPFFKGNTVVPNGRPPGFSMTPAQVLDQVILFEKKLTDQGKHSEEVRRAPLADALIRPKADRTGSLKVTLVTLNKWLAAWGVPIPPWPRDFVDDQGRPVLVCVLDARPPFRVLWISPNCEELLGRPREFYVGNSSRQLRTQVGALWQQQPELHEARMQAHAEHGEPFSAETTLSAADGLELPVEWTFRYGEHQTPKRERAGHRPTGTYYCCIVKIGEARSPTAHLEQALSDDLDGKLTRLFARHRELRSVTYGRDMPEGQMYVEVKGTLEWADLRRRVRDMNGMAQGRTTALGTLSTVSPNT